MEVLLITGESNTGKSETIYDTVDWLQARKGYTIVDTFHNHPLYLPKTSEMLDCEVLLENAKSKTILVHSATDDKPQINNLTENILELESRGKHVDILIASCRRVGDKWRDYMCKEMGWSLTKGGNVIVDRSSCPILEIPLLRIKYDNFPLARGWYKEQIERVVCHILERRPYNL